MMEQELRQRVKIRAGNRCEYCGLPQVFAAMVQFQIEHIVAKQHGGSDKLSNLAWACQRCNLSKGPNLAGIDFQTKRIVPLFHPRRQKWHRHFSWDGPLLIGLTPVGRATIHVLNMNDPHRLVLREQLIADGVFP